MLWFIVMLSRIPEGFNTNESQHSQAFPADLTKPKTHLEITSITTVVNNFLLLSRAF